MLLRELGHRAIGGRGANPVTDRRQPDQRGQIGRPIVKQGRHQTGAVGNDRRAGRAVEQLMQARAIRKGGQRAIDMEAGDGIFAHDVVRQHRAGPVEQLGHRLRVEQFGTSADQPPDQPMDDAGFAWLLPDLIAHRIEMGAGRIRREMPVSRRAFDRPARRRVGNDMRFVEQHRMQISHRARLRRSILPEDKESHCPRLSTEISGKRGRADQSPVLRIE